MRYGKDWKWGLEPFFPNHVVHQFFMVTLVMAVFFVFVFFLPGIFMLPEEPADPTVTPAHIKPEWYFLPAYQALKLVPKSIFGKWAEFVGIAVQGVAVVALIFLPFIDRNPERHTRKRPLLFVGSIITILMLFALGVWGQYS